MIFCGLKLTHDGCVALIKDSKLIFSVEMEKLNNNKRFAEIEDTSDIVSIFKMFDVNLADVDHFATDGWGSGDQEQFAIQPRLEVGKECNYLSISDNGIPYKLKLSLYEESSLKDNVLKSREFNGLKISGNAHKYSSYLHVATHIMGTYCTSPFAKNGGSSYVLVWDGGMFPRLYYVDLKSDTVENLGPIFFLIGNIYTIFSQHFGPFKVSHGFAKDSLSVAGKVMAYIALGEVKEELFKIFDEIYSTSIDYPMGFANKFATEFKEKIAGMDYKDEDILCTFHVYIEKMLINKLFKKVKRHGNKSQNICLAGGCALNIKWNSAIRNSGTFKNVYVSPFPNDSGSAIGAACCEMYKRTGNYYLEFSVYSGPNVIPSNPSDGWVSKSYDIKELAKLLNDTREPVVILNSRAELGPRALGNRSIVADVRSSRMKSILNFVKNREDYRPVSPICLESDAQKFFEPGTKDEFMLFDHKVKKEYVNEIPAILHLDGTARLQTVSKEENLWFTELLEEYRELTSIPMLCNTSANYNGSGFFPDVRSVTQWDKVNYVYSQGVLHERVKKIKFKR